MSGDRVDVLLVGAGLAGALIALRLKALRPELRVVALDRAGASADTHTWSFFRSDLSASAFEWVGPLARHAWPGYSVRFPGLERDVESPYCSIAESDLRETLRQALGADMLTSVDVEAVEPASVRLAGGEVIEAPLVIDGRGARPSAALWLAWQKFRGVEVRLKRPHGMSAPLLMDAQVTQNDGFRFLYVLPLGERSLLIEDTRYSASGQLDAAVVEADALRYARAKGWCVAEVVRRETGVLPLTLGGDIERFWAEQPAGVPAVGMRGAFFHPLTGYSVPDAVGVAEAIALAPRLASREVRTLLESRSKRLWAGRSFYRTLNRMLFLAAPPEERWRVLARFYGLPRPVIERFYAGTSTVSDKLRLVIGRPPVPIGPAVRAAIARRPATEAAAA